MKKQRSPLNGGLIITFTFLAAVTALAIAPIFWGDADAAVTNGSPEAEQRRGLPNYDIRVDKQAFEVKANLRQRVGGTPAAAADRRDGIARGEARLRSEVPNLKIEHNEALGHAEVIGAKPGMGRETLTGPAAGRRPEALKRFIQRNEELFARDENTDDLVVAADQENPEGELAFVVMNQEIDRVPVFGGEVKAGFTKRGEIIRVVNNLAPGLDRHGVVKEFGDPANAVRAAAGHIGRDLGAEEMFVNPGESTENKFVFGSGDWATTAEKFYFPLEIGTAVPAWRVLFWDTTDAYYVVVDAQGGELLWRKNIVEEQTQPATYNVYANPNAMIPVADSPNPLSPGPNGLTGAQGARINRTLVTRVGNEAPYTFNNNGWMTDGTNTTDGNAVEAGVDRENPAGIDPNGKPVPTTNRVFDFPMNPSNPSGMPNSGESPLPAGVAPGTCDAEGTNRPLIDFQKGVATQLFYIVNWFHDETYRLGFNEISFNFQHDNFGRGGLGGDRIQANAQVCLGTNGGSFGTGADGIRGRLNLFIWPGPDPDIDGSLDADVAIHELTHGLSNRLHGNAIGLATNMARGMGEGWSDLYAHAMLSEPSDPLDGVYAIGAYSTYLLFSGYTVNGYYGIRRFPKAIMSSTGGPQNRPHNPLTFADIDQTQINVNDGAFPQGPIGSSSSADQVHNAGEVWSSALWEVRAKYIQRLGWEIGNRRFLQHVTDGMKLSPLAPTFLNARDAILAAALGGGTPADAADVWSGFAIRGMGASASIQATGSGTGNARVTEAFDTPNLRQTPTITVADPQGNNNGYPDPGEKIVLSIPLTNNTGTTATGVTLNLVGGGSADYGTIGSGQTVVRDVSYVVDPGAVCGSLVTLTMNVNSSIGPVSFEHTIAVGTPVLSLAEDFDGVTAPGIPAGWTVWSTYAPMTWITTTTNPDTAPNSAFAADPAIEGGSTELQSPQFAVTSPAAMATFRHRFLTEPGWDGGVLEASINDGAWQDLLAVGGSFISNGYNSALGVSPPNPLGGRQAWSGNSNGYITTGVRLPWTGSAYNLRLRWRMGADNNTAPVNGGWNVDTIKIYGSYSCIIVDNFGAPFDFDGDGKTDVSIFRPANGEWWYGKSSDGGHGAAAFGTASDVIVPADYTGDGVTDIAFFRPSTGEWFVLRSEDFLYYSFPFGTAGDIPAPADYDGDGKADVAVYRPSTGTWYILRSSDGQVVITGFGVAGDQPVPADYDGDGKADIGVFRPNGPSGAEWWILRSTEGLLAVQFGSADSKAVPGDYTGDGKADVAFFSSTGGWYILRSEDMLFYSFPFGLGSDLPVPGDYDGDGKIDAAVFRNSEAAWYMLGSSSGTIIRNFGASGDRPVPNAFVR
ncbi:MAG TPA: M36 family metallopeptidase [Pyrinomonadaceae bacterium]|nr:M36 family metallopeptidase [Pyrinomonadaceae bacterium]